MRRDSYYVIDLTACQEALQTAGGALHPALRLAPAPPTRPRTVRSRRRRRVLFLCTGNSARSQMAEALVEQMSTGAIEAASGEPPETTASQRRARPSAAGNRHQRENRTKHLDEFVAQRFDTVITLCDRVREVCPDFPSHPELVHWSIPDPALDGASNLASYPAFERTATELETRINFRLHLPVGPATTRRSPNAQR